MKYKIFWQLGVINFSGVLGAKPLNSKQILDFCAY